MATTEQQQEKLQVCENNWVRRIAGVTRIDNRRVEELREEVGGREILTRKLVGERSSRGSWWERDPHEEVGEEPAKVGWSCGQNGRGTNVNVLKVEGRGRPRLRWEDCLTRDLVGVGRSGE